jgi:DNA-directed RNA polymerase specialized sigma24 family protein
MTIETFTAEQDPVVDAVTFVEFYWDTVEKAAHKELKGSKIFEAEDLMQEAWAVLTKDWEKFHSKGTSFVYGAAARVMQQYAARERASYGYFTGAFIYTPEIVRTQLELGAWESTPEGDWDMRLDVRAAYDALDERDRTIVARAYRFGESLKTSSERNILSRAIEKMSDHLNKGAGVKAASLDDLLISA